MNEIYYMSVAGEIVKCQITKETEKMLYFKNKLTGDTQVRKSHIDIVSESYSEIYTYDKEKGLNLLLEHLECEKKRYLDYIVGVNVAIQFLKDKFAES